MNDAERVARAERARMAVEEFVGPAFEVVRGEYEARLRERAAHEPWAAAKIAALANAMRIVDEVQGQLLAVIYDGEHARQGMIRAERIEKMTPAKRRFLGIAPY